MELKSLVDASNAANANIIVRMNRAKYVLRAEFKAEFVVCTNRAGDEREWRSMDTLLKHLNDNHYIGKVVIPMSTQIEILCNRFDVY